MKNKYQKFIEEKIMTGNEELLEDNDNKSFKIYELFKEIENDLIKRKKEDKKLTINELKNILQNLGKYLGVLYISSKDCLKICNIEEIHQDLLKINNEIFTKIIIVAFNNKKLLIAGIDYDMWNNYGIFFKELTNLDKYYIENNILKII